MNPPLPCRAAARISLLAALSLLLPAAAKELFPPVSELDPALRMPPGPVTLGIAPDGNFLVDGRPRYLLGTIVYHQPSGSELDPGPGYAPENAWIYETIPDRDYLQRLGFDTVGGEVSQTWMQAYRPEKSFWQGQKGHDWSIASNYWCCGLPTIADFTCARWSHGAIQFKEGRDPSRAAIPEGGAGHFLPYSLVTKEGRDLYAAMWRAGAEELKAHGARPYAYELFNEPSVNDRSPEARAAFAEHLAAVFDGDPARMDKLWGSRYGSFEAAAAFRSPNECAGLGVEWLKFCENVFASGIRLGRDTIREVVPDARVCFQPLSIAFGYLNVLQANRDCGVVMSGTGGQGLYETLLLLAVAQGKPVIDGETYLGHTRGSHRAKIVTQWSRGFNASYYFKWERRLRDPTLQEENGAARLAEKFPWLGLHPPCTPTEALAGLMDAKREIFAMEDLFGPRERGLPASNRVAFLVSLPTERLGAAAGHACHNFSKADALAMAQDAHLPLDAVFEEDDHLAAFDFHRTPYRFLVAAGVDATRGHIASDQRILESWAKEDGGTLALLQEAMELDEYGNPVAYARDRFPGISLGAPCKAEAQRFAFRGAEYEAVPYREVAFATNAGWSVVAALPDGHPAVACREIGKGRVWYVGVRFPNAGDEGRLLAALAADCGIAPTCETQDPATRSPVDGIEVQAARGENGDVGFVICNRTLSPRAVRFLPRGAFALLSHAESAEADTHAELGSHAESAELGSHAESAELGSHAEVAESAEAGSPDGRAPARPERGSGGAEPPVLLDLSRRVLLVPDSEGAFLLLLEPDVPVVLRSRPAPGLPPSERGAARSAGGSTPCGAISAPSASGIAVESYEETFARMPAWLAERAPKAVAKAFSVDPSRVRFLDLAPFANRSYGDTVAGDGKGGWTDQGENHLRHAPWGPTDCNGVPFDFIRPDQNDDRACVMLRSTHLPDLPDAVRGITVGCKAEAVYFLHAGAWVAKDVEGFRYVVHYADGTLETAPMVGGVDFGDWWVDTRRLRLARAARRFHTGWANSESKGFHVLRWENPHPEKTLATIDIESACGETIPIIEAISVELPDESPFAARRLKLKGWGGVKPERDGAALVLSLTDGSANWCGANLILPSPAPFAGDPAAYDLVFEANGGRTPLGAEGPGGQRFQIALRFRLADGGEKSGPYVGPKVEGDRIDADPATWQTVRIPVRRLLPKDAPAAENAVLSLNVQYRDLPADRAALVIRNLRLEKQ